MNVLAVILLCCLLCVIIVSIHHETLLLITRGMMPRFSRPRRWHVGVTVLVLMAAHVLEILVYGVGLYVAGHYLDLGGLAEVDDEAALFSDYLYFSLTSYTSLGIGDVFPQGALRFMTGVEALLGLVMIGWTSSFLFLEMRIFWSVGGKEEPYH